MIKPLLMATLMIASTGLSAQEASADSSNPQVVLHTNYGDITIELFEDKAPKSVKNFLQYVDDGFYAGTVFHRVISHFMIQGGGFTQALSQKPTRAPISNEADNKVSNKRGTVAMARTGDPHSATAQFFINVEDNPYLDHKGKESGRTWGYAVFGQVIDGMDVVDEIRNLKTGPRGPFGSDVPVDDAIIESAERVSTEG